MRCALITLWPPKNNPCCLPIGSRAYFNYTKGSNKANTVDYLSSALKTDVINYTKPTN